MKKEILVFSIVILLFLNLFGMTFDFIPLVSSSADESFKEVWKTIEVHNPQATSTVADINVNVSSRDGVNIALSTSITEYFENETEWKNMGYNTYMEWLNGKETLPYHWGDIDWYVSNGSLTNIAYDEIQHWGDLYLDSGGGVQYVTFMYNTYMADWNLSATYNDPDIISPSLTWTENKITLEDLVVPNASSIWIVLKIVITDPGVYLFNVTSPQGIVEVSPSSWKVGGAATLLVPDEYSTIQAAINVASPGDTIIVHDGTYAEDLGIPATKTNLEIKPAAGASVIIKGVQNVPVASFPLAIPNIEINANGVKIHGFTIEGPDYTSGKYSSGMVIGASNVDIYNNTFKVTPAATLDEISQSIQTYHKNARPGVDVSGLSIHNNMFTHLSAGAAGYEGVYINLDEGTDTVAVQYNYFNGSIVRAITTERSKTTISGNTILTDLAPNLPGGYQGINVGGANAGNVTNVSVAGNTIKGFASGKGFKYGIKLGYSSTSTFINVSVISNTIQMNEVGVWVKFSANGVKVKWNNFIGNINYGVWNTYTAETVNAAYNWWGNETGPHHPTLNPTGYGDNVSDNANFIPWLIQSYPPEVPVGILDVEPSTVEFWTPAHGNIFDLQVKTSNATLLYGFQFNLTWDESLLSLESVTYSPPWVQYYEVKETIASSYYLLALSATGSAPPFNGTTTLATLNFKVIYDPVYPNNVTCDLKLQDVTMGDPDGHSMPHLVHSGNYSCYSKKPEIILSPQEYSAHKVPTEFGLNINVTNVVNLHKCEIKLTYNSTLLNVMDVEINPFFGGAYLTGWEVNNTLGTVFISIKDIIPYANGSGSIATVTFRAIYSIVWNVKEPSINCTLEFSSNKLFTAGDVAIEHDAVNGIYYYMPVEGDLNRDGTVELIDLVIAGQAFGLDPTPPYDIADLNRDGLIDILDIIIIARNYGRTS